MADSTARWLLFPFVLSLPRLTLDKVTPVTGFLFLCSWLFLPHCLGPFDSFWILPVTVWSYWAFCLCVLRITARMVPAWWVCVLLLFTVECMCFVPNMCLCQTFHLLASSFCFPATFIPSSHSHFPSPPSSFTRIGLLIFSLLFIVHLLSQFTIIIFARLHAFCRRQYTLAISIWIFECGARSSWV